MSWFWKRDTSHDGETVYSEESAALAAKQMLIGNTGYRAETQVRVPEAGTIDANTPSTAVPDLILLDPKDKYSYEYQDIVAREDPVAHYTCDVIAENVYDDWFYLAERGTEEPHAMNDTIQKEFERMNAKHYLILCLKTERRHGHSWLDVIPTATGGEDYREDIADFEIQPKIAKLDVYSPLYTEVVEWDTKGQPTKLKVNITMPNGAVKDIPIEAKDCILMRTRPRGDRTYRGDSILSYVWDDLTYSRQVMFAMGWYAIKVGIGVFYVKVRGALTSEKRSAAEAVLQGISTKRGIIYSDLVIDEFGFIQAGAGATDFPKYVDSLMTRVAIGTGIPKDILTGLSGTNEASQTALDLRNNVINTEQRKQEFYIREVIARMGYDIDYDIIWPVRYASSEEAEAKIYQSNTQADVQALEFMSVNEIRAKRNLEPVDGGDEILGLRKDIQIGMQGQGIDQQNKTNNPGGDQV